MTQPPHSGSKQSEYARLPDTRATASAPPPPSFSSNQGSQPPIGTFSVPGHLPPSGYVHIATGQPINIYRPVPKFTSTAHSPFDFLSPLVNPFPAPNPSTASSSPDDLDAQFAPRLTRLRQLVQVQQPQPPAPPSISGHEAARPDPYVTLHPVHHPNYLGNRDFAAELFLQDKQSFVRPTISGQTFNKHGWSGEAPFHPVLAARFGGNRTVQMPTAFIEAPKETNLESLLGGISGDVLKVGAHGQQLVAKTDVQMEFGYEFTQELESDEEDEEDDKPRDYFGKRVRPFQGRQRLTVGATSRAERRTGIETKKRGSLTTDNGAPSSSRSKKRRLMYE